MNVPGPPLLDPTAPDPGFSHETVRTESWLEQVKRELATPVTAGQLLAFMACVLIGFIIGYTGVEAFF